MYFENECSRINPTPGLQVEVSQRGMNKLPFMDSYLFSKARLQRRMLCMLGTNFKDPPDSSASAILDDPTATSIYLYLTPESLVFIQSASAD